MWDVQLCELNYDNREADAVQKVLSSEWLTMGSVTAEFEHAFSEFHSGAQCVAVSSATAGLHLILMAIGVCAGDEVIIPGLTFVSDANVVCQLGAVPVFADVVGPNNLNVSVDDVISKVTERTKAIVAVHFAGYPINLTGLRTFCDQRNIVLVEDVAHAPGAETADRKCGTFGHASFFSFFSNKNLAVGEGGMVMSCDRSIADKVRSMRSHGMTSLTLDRHKGRSFSYDVVNVGLNYRLDEIRASLGLVQLSKLLEANQKRKLLTLAYIERLKSSEVVLPNIDQISTCTPAFHIMPVLLPDFVCRSSLMREMTHRKIQTSIHYPNFRELSQYNMYFEGGELPNTEIVTAREVTLPLHPRMTLADVDLVSDNLLEIVNEQY